MKNNIAFFVLGLILAFVSVTASATLVVRVQDSLAGTHFEQISPTSTTYTLGVDYTFFNLNWSAGDVTGPLGLVDNIGCNVADFSGFLAGSIALIERGDCLFSDKVNNAAVAGAIGAIIFDNLFEALPSVTHFAQVSIPSIFITRTLGLELQSQIPEPNALALMGLGLAGIGYRRRKAA